MAIKLDLSYELQDRIRQKVTSGDSPSVSDLIQELIQETLRLMDERSRRRAAMLKLLRQGIQTGITRREPTPEGPEEFEQEGKRQAGRTR